MANTSRGASAVKLLYFSLEVETKHCRHGWTKARPANETWNAFSRSRSYIEKSLES